MRSLRDPGGYLADRDGRLLRVVNAGGEQNARLWLEAPCLEPLRKAGRLIGTRVLDQAETESRGLSGAEMVLEHERIPFVGYPYEWPAEMLVAAGELTLDLAEALLPAGLGLKDATPFNILFRGGEPVFVDALSVETREGRDPLWHPMAQFERTFVYPLLAQRSSGLALRQSLGVNREGLEPEEMVKLAGPVRKWMRPYLGLATIPTWLGKRKKVERPDFYRRHEVGSAEQAQFILERGFRSARRALRQAGPPADARSGWSEYQAAECHYREEDRAAKRRVVEQALHQLTAGSAVLDVGANLGEYSRIAAGLGHRVVATDMDAITMGRLWRQVRSAKEDILPLVVDFSSPTPGTGWENSEGISFLNRAKQGFDCVLMLAVVHHLLVTHGIPLEDIVFLASQLARQSLLAEYVGPDDPLFQRLCRGREELYRDFNQEEFESQFLKRFPILRKRETQQSGRVMFWFEKQQRTEAKQ